MSGRFLRPDFYLEIIEVFNNTNIVSTLIMIKVMVIIMVTLIVKVMLLIMVKVMVKLMVKAKKGTRL